jgi:RNA polymerase sigma-70 factor (ECF subfamily)
VVDADDGALVAAARAGDREALDRLLRRHHDRIHAVCRRLSGNDADALDATQEALIAIARGIGRFDGRARFSTWAYRVATNACLDELRRRRRRPVPGLPEDHDGLEAGVVDPAATVPLDALEDRLRVDAALAELPIEFRAAVVLRDLCDLDYAEIADVLAIPPGTVRSRIARGRSQLARLLGPGNREPATGRPTSGAGDAPPPTP